VVAFSVINTAPCVQLPGFRQKVLSVQGVIQTILWAAPQKAWHKNRSVKKRRIGKQVVEKRPDRCLDLD
jgi:hypothetical protein